MKYISTRDTNTDTPSSYYTFEDAILSGYAPHDGGLFVPETLPKDIFTPQTLVEEYMNLSYIELSQRILRLFIDKNEIDDDNLQNIVTNAFTFNNNDSDNENDTTASNSIPIPIPINDTSIDIDGLYISELYHGPTYCFKDFGLRVLINMLGYFASKRKKKIVLVVATTGDTGPAAVQAIYDLPNQLQDYISIIVHYPKGQISNFQRKQLTTLSSKSVRIVSFCGGGDDMDIPIKRIQQQQQETKKKKTKNQHDNQQQEQIQPNEDDGNDKEEKEERIICGINSYNIGRPLSQMIHFVWTYLRILEKHLKKQKQKETSADDTTTTSSRTLQLQQLPVVDVIVPTGAMGNLVGGYMCKCMGIPFGTFCTAVNINDTTHVVIQTGEFYKPKKSFNDDNGSDEMYKTLSEAINIQLPYNFERLLYYLTNENHELIKQWYYDLEHGYSKKIVLPKVWHDKLQSEFCSVRVTDDELCTTIRNVYDQYKYFVDPHTGVAITSAERLGYIQFSSDTKNDTEDGSKKRKFDGMNGRNPSSSSAAVVIMATASPCKFEEAVTIALGEERWKEYYESNEFPQHAKETMERPEKDPIIYNVAEVATTTLEESQLEWEKLTRNLIDQM